MWPNQVPLISACPLVCAIIGHSIRCLRCSSNGCQDRSSARHARTASGCVPPGGTHCSVQCLDGLPGMPRTVIARSTLAAAWRWPDAGDGLCARPLAAGLAWRPVPAAPEPAGTVPQPASAMAAVQAARPAAAALSARADLRRTGGQAVGCRSGRRPARLRCAGFWVMVKLGSMTFGRAADGTGSGYRACLVFRHR